VCDVPSHDNSPPLDVSKDQIEDLSESTNEFSSLDEDSFSIDDIDYVEASPLDSELVSSESRVKEEESIIDVENTVFDSVMEPLGFLLVDERIFIGLMTKFIEFIELNVFVITRSLKIKVCIFLRPSRLCAQAQSVDDTPFHKQDYMEYTQLVFCKLFGMPKERHPACPTRMHGSLLLSFQGYVLNHRLIPPPGYLFGVIRGS
nr:hypothetical protein [Tanacetum cinerariifolium]